MSTVNKSVIVGQFDDPDKFTHDYIVTNRNGTYFAKSCYQNASLILPSINKQTVVQAAIDALDGVGSIFLRGFTLPAGLSYGASMLIIESVNGKLTYYSNGGQIADLDADDHSESFRIYLKGSTYYAKAGNSSSVYLSNSNSNTLMQNLLDEVSWGCKFIFRGHPTERQIYFIDQLVIPTALRYKGLKFVGESFQPIIAHSATTPKAMIVSENPTQETYYLGFADLQFWHSANITTRLFDFSKVGRSTVKGCYFFGSGHGASTQSDISIYISGDGAYFNSIVDNYFDSPLTAIQLDNVGGLANNNFLHRNTTLRADNAVIINTQSTSLVSNSFNDSYVAALTFGSVAAENHCIDARMENTPPMGGIGVIFNASSYGNEIAYGSIVNNAGFTTLVQWNGSSGNRLWRVAQFVTENQGHSTGTGAQQTIAHGLSFTPTYDQVVLSERSTGGALPRQSAVPDATNIYITATLNKDYIWRVSQ